MGQSRQTCPLCGREPGGRHRAACARSAYQQARLGALLGSLGVPRWLHVSTMLATDSEIEGIGEHTIPAGSPRSDATGIAFFLLPGETYTRPPNPALGLPGTPPGAGGRPRAPQLARFAYKAPRKALAAA